MNKFLLNAETKGKMILFSFSVLYIGLTIIAAFSGFSGGLLLDAFAGLPKEQAGDVGAVIAGFLFVPVTLYWVYACFFCFIMSLLVSRKLNDGQRKRLSCICFVFYTTIASIASPFVLPYIDSVVFYAANFVIYVILLKVWEYFLVKKLG